MNQLQRDAMRPRRDLTDMTEEDAKHILNWYYGSSPIQVYDRAALCVGVRLAVETLGGVCRRSWGVTQLPNYVPVDEV